MKHAGLLRSQINLPTSTAVWVLGAHLFALLSPLAIAWVIGVNWQEISSRSDFPVLWYAAIALMMVASAFEIAQNTFDRWYLVPECGSAELPALSDLLFYLFAGLSQVLLVAALIGAAIWPVILAFAAVVAFGVLYVGGRTPFAALGMTTLLVSLALYFRLEEPLAFLLLGTGPFTVYFYRQLLSTGAQSLHGATAAAASAGPWIIAWVAHRGATGVVDGWKLLPVVALSVLIAGALLWRPLGRLSATPRPFAN